MPLLAANYNRLLIRPRWKSWIDNWEVRCQDSGLQTFANKPCKIQLSLLSFILLSVHIWPQSGSLDDQLGDHQPAFEANKKSVDNRGVQDEASCDLVPLIGEDPEDSSVKSCLSNESTSAIAKSWFCDHHRKKEVLLIARFQFLQEQTFKLTTLAMLKVSWYPFQLWGIPNEFHAFNSDDSDD